MTQEFFKNSYLYLISCRRPIASANPALALANNPQIMENIPQVPFINDVILFQVGRGQKGKQLGAIFILRKDIGVGGWSRKWQFSLTLRSENVLTWVGGWFKKASKHPYVI